MQGGAKSERGLRSSAVPPIRSARLDLVSLDVRSIEMILADRIEDAELRLEMRLPPDLGMRAAALLQVRLADLRSVPEAQAWLLRLVAVRTPVTRMVGFIGFHGPPSGNREVEIGYEILASDRRRGYATEAASAMLEWATCEHGIHAFLASVSPTNAASLGVVAKLGFHPNRSRHDPVDGAELVFRLDR
ncbi:MAG TPA: GNAT family N-acetyltransferase [Candidatus Saccharimonadales bacterium]|nr:GNAT family N-acetyltransferase [Candidatus Saccharimonadales bacterium]